MLEEYRVHTTFNITNLIPLAGSNYDDNMEPLDLRTNPPQKGGDDDIVATKGPINRSMLRRI